MVSLLTEGTESAWYLPHLNCHFLPPYAWLYSYKLSKNSHLPNWVIECQACLLKIVKDESNICIKKILSCLSLAFPSAFDQLHETREKIGASFPFFLQTVKVWLHFQEEILQGWPVSWATVYCWNKSMGEVEESLGLLVMGWGTAAACFSLSGCPVKDKGWVSFPW